jgi:penicillin-binding protein 1B
MPNGTVWSPQNYDKVFHGLVPLRSALANSYNLATARIGMEVGVKNVIRTMQQLGVSREMKPYPSLLLGAVALTPLEVMQMYHTLASAGFRSPLRAIREVLNNQGEPLQRYPWSVEKVAEPGPLYLLNHAMQYAVRSGTGRGIYRFLQPSINVAGKTGTSDDLRDSWFAGYTEDKLGVVWIGKDNNEPTGLTGSSGALRVWAEIFAAINPRSGEPSRPDNVELVLIDQESGLLASNDCDEAAEIPFIKGSSPTELAPCAGGTVGAGGWVKGLF